MTLMFPHNPFFNFENCSPVKLFQPVVDFMVPARLPKAPEGMTVQELIEFLQQFNPEAKVCFYGEELPVAGGHYDVDEKDHTGVPSDDRYVAKRVDLQPPRSFTTVRVMRAITSACDWSLRDV